MSAPTRGPVAHVGPSAGAAVMGTGIVSTALELTGRHGVADGLLVVACALWVALALVAAGRLVRDPAGAARGARAAEALSAVAATCVLGSRFVIGGHAGVGAVLLAAGAALWAALVGPALRALPARAHGGTFLIAVGTESVAVLAAALAAARDAAWLLAPAALLALLGAAFYLDVLRRFDPRELLRGHGDQWVVGGALAITALAGAELQQGATTLGVVPGVHDALRVATIALLVAAAAWLPVLVAGELARPRPRYDARRWASVFPVGMYAAVAATVGRAEGSTLLSDVARAGAWVALAVWAVVAVGLLRAGAHALRSARA
ncbi:hypothetical protein [Patulibacter sp. SYSU D01012]|uniref:SLAC1 family transporter n=1 Tax=Patulibacter sp. SYSU D01012 TaxID=2817381 RepID=UPI001B30A0EA